MTRLGDYISEFSVKNHLDESIPVYSVTNDRGFCSGYFNKDVASKDKTTYKIVPRGYFAYNPSRINVGSIAWQNSAERVIVSPLYVCLLYTSGRGIAVVVGNEGIFIGIGEHGVEV